MTMFAAFTRVSVWQNAGATYAG